MWSEEKMGGNSFPKTFRIAAILLVLFAVLFIWFYLQSQTIPVIDLMAEHELRQSGIKSAAEDVKNALPRSSGLTWKKRKFYLNGREFYILSGAMHYFRIPPSYWIDRLKKLKAAGLNTVETYVAWNIHEPVQGHFKFSDALSIRTFIQAADDLGLYVILRPGPYICAEWDWGGLPSWLLKIPDIKVRSSDSRYMEAVESYMARILSEIHDLQYSEGGPIIAFQVENEFGAYKNGADRKYMESLVQLFKYNSIKEALITSDYYTDLDVQPLPGPGRVLRTINFKHYNAVSLERLRELEPEAPFMVTEFWTGWFTHWGEYFQTFSPNEYETNLRKVLQHVQGVNLYMFHGGTNWGFYNGANWFPGRIQPTVTSYDYDAPLSECGNLTEKFMITRRLIEELIPYHLRRAQTHPAQRPRPLPPLPKPVKLKRYGEFLVSSYLSLNHILKVFSPVQIRHLATMESIDLVASEQRGFGFILYRKFIQFPDDKLGSEQVLSLQEADINDRAIILIDSKEQTIIDKSNLSGRLYESQQSPLRFHPRHNDVTLDILVENMGRINYFPSNSAASLDDQRKGISGNIFLNDEQLFDWNVYLFDFNEHFLLEVTYSENWKKISSSRLGPKVVHRKQRDLRSLPPSLSQQEGSHLTRSAVDESISSFLPSGPAIYRVFFNIDGDKGLCDTYLTLYTGTSGAARTRDRVSWTKGIVVINDFILGRYWTWPNSLYVPKSLLKLGENLLLIFELHQPDTKVIFIDYPLHNIGPQKDLGLG